MRNDIHAIFASYHTEEQARLLSHEELLKAYCDLIKAFRQAVQENVALRAQVFEQQQQIADLQKSFMELQQTLFELMRKYMPRLNGLVDKMEKKAHLKGQKVSKYKYVGLWLFVAIPLPGTGAWTGALVAAFLDMPLRKALPSIFLGVVTAGLIMTFATGLVVATVGG